MNSVWYQVCRTASFICICLCFVFVCLRISFMLLKFVRNSPVSVRSLGTISFYIPQVYMESARNWQISIRVCLHLEQILQIHTSQWIPRTMKYTVAFVVQPQRDLQDNWSCIYYYLNQLMQLCTARTAWSDSDEAVRAVHSCNSWWLGPLWSDSVIKLVSVLFGICTTLVVTKFWPMETRLPCGDQWKAEKLEAF